MRVAYDVTPIDGHLSGVGNYALHLLNHLIEEGMAHEYLPLSNRWLDPSCLSGGNCPLLDASSLIIRRSSLAAMHPFPSRMLWMQCILPRMIRVLRPHLCHYTNSIGPLANPCPYVVTIHDMTLSLLPGYHPWRKQLIVRPIVALVARRAHRIITVSEHARQDIIRLLHVPSERVVVTPEAAAPIFTPASAAEQQRVRTQYHLNGPYLLYVGTLEPRKNLVRLIRAWHSLHSRDRIAHRLVIVGARGWHDAPIFHEVQALGCVDAVTFTGYVPLGDLPALYTAADAFAFPSLYEGFGLPVMEAMACGTPVLISSTPALVEVAGESALQIDASSTHTIASGIERLLTDHALRAQLRQRGLQRSAQFSWQRTARQTLQIYADAVARGAQASQPGDYDFRFEDRGGL